MKVTFPHMGTLWVAAKAILEDLDLEVVVPPRPTTRTMNLGVKHSPEFACLPLKLCVGNYLEAFERGADAIVMAGGIGPCRFGYYAQVEREILNDLGYSYRMIVLEPPKGHLSDLVNEIKGFTGQRSLRRIYQAALFGYRKLGALDAIERRTNQVRVDEAARGGTGHAVQKATALIDRAASMDDLKTALARGLEVLDQVPRKESGDPLKIGLVGEVYMLLEPYVNLDIERQLGEMGVLVERHVYLTDWVRSHLTADFLRFDHEREMRQAAKPYLGHWVGGHGVETIGNSVLYARRGFDGVIQVAPLTCMPEIVARSLLPVVSQDHGIPFLSLFLDEHAGEAGLRTRLEAFVDLLERRREQRRRRASTLSLEVAGHSR
ncbi:MAG TPA: CoA protein activase [Bacillota bacterium]|jgi:predicted nucleotide-binding protein (sugar kinase/HSP70/actin superfamily)